MLFNNQRWNRDVMNKHLDKFHGIDIKADDGGKTEVEPRSQVAQYQHRKASIKKIEKGKRAHMDTEKEPEPESVRINRQFHPTSLNLSKSKQMKMLCRRSN